MRCHSISTVTTGGYRAGSELGEGLRALAPEVILLFASINYQNQFADIFDGLNDALGKAALIFGGTSGGIYETERVTHHGLCALGLNSDGAVQWTVAVELGWPRIHSARRALARSAQSKTSVARRTLLSLSPME